MTHPITRYARWLHTQWPAGRVEKMPRVNPDGSTGVPGVFIAGDLAGIPLLKFSADSGARAVAAIAADPAFQKRRSDDPDVVDLAILGCGVAGLAAALEARKLGLRFEIIEAAEPLSTIVNFPKAKPIFTYPTDMAPAGDLQFPPHADVKEKLLDELQQYMAKAQIQPRPARATRIRRDGALLKVELAPLEPHAPTPPDLRAHRVLIAIGRSGNYRKLHVPGEDLDKVYNRLHDPADFAHRNVLVVGGGDSALEAAIALARCSAHVTLSYRKARFSRPKPENLEQIQRLAADPRAPITLKMPTTVKAIHEHRAELAHPDGRVETIDNDVVFTLIGREPPLDFLRRCGLRINGEWRLRSYLSFALVLIAFTILYHWKKPGIGLPIGDWFKNHHWFPYQMADVWASLGPAFNNPAHLLGTLKVSVAEPGFYYSTAYCLVMLIFGIRRIRRRKTPYVTRQTATLIAIQWLPLFVLPYLLLPWLGHNGYFDQGFGKQLADAFFPAVHYGHGREYWRAFGFILAWPLFLWNVFTDQPLWGWLIVSFAQTFILIPWMVRRWGKGAYCGWVCSCGGMAETLGDTHRHKMPHGPVWNRLNMLGQVVLLFAGLLLLLRIAGWLWPASVFAHGFSLLMHDIPFLNYTWLVDLLLAGIIGFGFYFHFSGRVWCRFACPLAALMHIYARFSRFRILAEKKKCISCNICTTVCHQGIDVMNFANKGQPMADPQCVRCSACVQMCPTGVLHFGRVDRHGRPLAPTRPPLAASPVQIAELTGHAATVSAPTG